MMPWSKIALMVLGVILIVGGIGAFVDHFQWMSGLMMIGIGAVLGYIGLKL